MGILGNSKMTTLFLRTLAGIAAFHLVAALLVYRLTEPGPAPTFLVIADPAASQPSVAERIALQRIAMERFTAAGPPEVIVPRGAPAVLVREVEPIVFAGPSPAVFYSEPAVPMPEEPEARADALEEVRQVRAIGPIQELDVRAATRAAAARARQAAMRSAVARR
jgi:hypothetical protein